MSDLQLGLIVIGVVVIVAVIVFNRWQERQLRRQVEDTFASIDTAPLDDAQGARIEPTFERPLSPVAEGAEGASGSQRTSAASTSSGTAGATSGATVTATTTTGTAATATTTAATDASPHETAESAIDYVCSIWSSAPMPHERLTEFSRAAPALGKRVTVHAWLDDVGQWAELPLSASHPITHLRAALQLADRNGPVNRVQIATMRDLVRQLAQHVDGECECPEIDPAVQAAVELDRFCAQIDVSISCHVVPRSDAGLPGTKVRGLLESNGYSLAADGKFWLHADDGTLLLSAADAKGEAFSIERLRTESLAGLTLSMDVPKAPAGGRLLDRMLETARHMAHALDAIVVDDNRKPLTEAGLGVIRQQVRAVHAAMEGRGIAAGSPTAARLFS